MIEINSERFFQILEELAKLEEKYNIHFIETEDGFILQKIEMYDINYKVGDIE